METIGIMDKDANLPALLARVREKQRSVAIIDSNGDEYLLSKRRRRNAGKPVEYDPAFIAKIERSRRDFEEGKGITMSAEELRNFIRNGLAEHHTTG